MIAIDGAQGEGGGQILRSALSLSMCTNQPFRIENIRGNREKPGLMRQHLTAVRAAAAICEASVSGDEVGSMELTFRPGTVKPGNYSFAIGTAGSCTLVLQTLLPPLLTASDSSQIRISGGTHNKASPPVDFLQRAYLPLVERMGPRVSLELVRHGFYPRGGGEILATITPVSQLSHLSLMERGSRSGGYAEAYVAAIPLHVAQRELEIVGKMLNWPGEQLHVRGLPNDVGPGNALTLTVEHEAVTEVFTGFGEKGVSAEHVAKGAAERARAYLAAPVAVGKHLADQLLLPIALAGGGEITTLPVSAHFQSHALIIETFLGHHVSAISSGGVVHARIGESRQESTRVDVASPRRAGS
jgi:RNA 3'-terminal phosphate cyclase (ATP)